MISECRKTWQGRKRSTVVTVPPISDDYHHCRSTDPTLTRCSRLWSPDLTSTTDTYNKCALITFTTAITRVYLVEMSAGDGDGPPRGGGRIDRASPFQPPKPNRSETTNWRADMFFYKLSPLFCGWKNGGLSSRATLMDKELIVKCVINGRLRQSPQCLVPQEHFLNTLLYFLVHFSFLAHHAFVSRVCDVRLVLN